VVASDETTVLPPSAGEQDSRVRARARHELDPADVAARFAYARARGQPHWLWPDCAPADWRLAMLELQRITASLLRNDQPRPTLTADIPFDGLTVAAFTSGLGPWLGWHVEQGALNTASDAAAELLALHLTHARRRYERMHVACEQVVAVVRAAGARVTVLKGMHTAGQYFAKPAVRVMADIDVLVDDVAVAERALAEAGYTEDRARRHARPLRAEWRSAAMPTVPRSLTLVHADDSFAIDLHGSLDIDFFGVYTVPFDRVVARMRTESPAWTGTHALAQPLLAAHHAVHASHGMHGLTLIRLVELSLMLRRDMRSRDDWRQLDALLQELRAERFALLSFALVDTLLPGAVDPHFLEGLYAAAPARLRNVASTLQPVDAQRLEGLSLSERFLWANGVREHAQRLAFMLWPTGRRGPVSRALRIYRERFFRILRGQITWRDRVR
jgi:hypothetical protein